MTKIIVLEPNGTVKNIETLSYATKDMLQVMKQKINKLKLTKGDKQPRVLASLSIATFQLQILGWNAGDDSILNKNFNDIIDSNKKKRINSLVKGNYYGDLVIIKTTLATKILNLVESEYKTLLDKLNEKTNKTKKTLTLKSKNQSKNQSDDEDEENDNEKDDEENEEEEDDDEEEDEYISDEDDDENDEEDDVYKNNKKNKFKNLEDSEEEDEEDDEKEDEEEDEEDEDYEDDDDKEYDEVDEDFVPVEIDKLDVEVKKKHKHKQKKDIDLDSYGDMLIIEKKGVIKNNVGVIRDEIIETLNKIIKNKKKCRQIEQGIYNYCILTSSTSDIIPRWDSDVFRSMYINKSRSIYTNLSESSYVNNIDFIEKFNANKIDLYNIAFMKPYEMFPERWNKIREDEYRRNKLLYQTKEVAMTDQYMCRRCKKRETTYFELQIRSADEPATLFITCINCGNRWSKNP